MNTAQGDSGALVERIACPLCGLTVELVKASLEGGTGDFWYVADHCAPATAELCEAAAAEYNPLTGTLA
jgi:hypothetical protein